MNRMRRILAASVVLLLAFSPAAVHAQSSATNPNNEVTRLIQSGLWQGVNFDLVPRFGATDPPRNNPEDTPATAGAYLALGDSVAAGVGLDTPVAEPSSEKRCGRTREAYPYQVAASLGLPLIHRACSGATTRDFYTRDWTPSPSIPSQLSVAFAGGTPGLITMTSGANDVRWLGFLQNCYRRDCATTASTDTFNASLRVLEGRLDYVFRQIQYRSEGSPPPLIITGYYDPASPACSGLTPSITSAEIAWISGGVARLNQTIQNVASRYAFARFAEVDFAGHDICSDDPWVQGLGNPQPFHPTLEGQQVMARAVLAAYGQ